MKSQKRRLASLLVCTVLLCISAFPTWAKVPYPSAEYYVLDNAKVLSAQTRIQVVSDGRALYALTGVKASVVIRDTDEEELTTEAYFDVLWKNWKLDQLSEKNGFLLLLDLPNASYCAKADVGLSKMLDKDTLCDILQTYLEPDFADGNYAEAICKTYTAISSKIALQTATLEKEPSKIDKILRLFLPAEKAVTAQRGDTTVKLWLSSTGKTLFTILLVLFLLIGIFIAFLPRIRIGFFSRYRKREPKLFPFLSSLFYKKKDVAGYEIVTETERTPRPEEPDAPSFTAGSVWDGIKNGWLTVYSWVKDWIAQMKVTGSDHTARH